MDVLLQGNLTDHFSVVVLHFTITFFDPAIIRVDIGNVEESGVKDRFELRGAHSCSLSFRG